MKKTKAEASKKYGHNKDATDKFKENKLKVDNSPNQGQENVFFFIMFFKEC